MLTQDDSLGEMAGADVLVEGDKIAEVGRGLSADGARVIEADGDIVIPGFVDTHRHTWETSIRTSAPDYTLGAYFGAILDKFAPKYRPEDVYAGNLWGSLECLNAGITTLVDWSHIMNTPEHADEAVRGLQESGIRSVFAFGFPNTSIQAWWFGMDYAGSTERINGDEARRVRSQYLSDDQGLITMALATRGTNFCKEDVVRYEWELAKELGINITVHVAMDRFGYTKMQLRGLKEMDLLYPNTTYIHSSHLLDDEWLMVRDSGGNVSLAPQIELQMGHGWAPAAKASKLGIPVGLSSDVATTASSDQFTQMHAIFASERARRHGDAWDADPSERQGHHRPDRLAPGPALGDPRGGQGRRRRRSDRLDHARQEGRSRDHRHEGRERRAGHRPGRRGRLRGGHLERADRARRWPRREGRLQAARVARCAAPCRGGVARLPRRRVRRAGARMDGEGDCLDLGSSVGRRDAVELVQQRSVLAAVEELEFELVPRQANVP